MTSPTFHRFDRYGPACGTRDGVNALDMEGEVTCKRCRRMMPGIERGQHYEYREDRVFLVQGPPDASLPSYRQGVSFGPDGSSYYRPGYGRVR
jgi:hypothetical protein